MAYRHLIRKELREAWKLRWFLILAGLFGILGVLLSAFSLAGAGIAGIAGFGRTAAGVVNLALLLVPLMGLTLAALSWTGEEERGALAYLLTYPVSRTEVFVAKGVGLALVLAATLLLAFGSMALVLFLRGVAWTWSDGLAFAGVTLSAILLGWATLALGSLVGVRERRQAAAAGWSVLLWFLLVFVADLGLMGTAMVTRMSPKLLLFLSLLNPLQAFKILAVFLLEATPELLGPAGWYAWRTFGQGLLALLWGDLILWTVVPALAAGWAFRRKEVV